MLELRVSVEEPVPPGLRLTPAGLMEAVRPERFDVEVRVIVPVKPARLLRVMAEVPELPAWMVTVPGLAEMVKSPTPTVTVVVWERDPLVAVTVTA